MKKCYYNRQLAHLGQERCSDDCRHRRYCCYCSELDELSASTGAIRCSIKIKFLVKKQNNIGVNHNQQYSTACLCKLEYVLVRYQLFYVEEHLHSAFHVNGEE